MAAYNGGRNPNHIVALYDILNEYAYFKAVLRNVGGKDNCGIKLPLCCKILYELSFV